MFKKDFANYVVVGDRLTCEVDGFHCVATVHHDEDTKPDSETMPLEAFSAWANDEWFYVGVGVTVWKAGVKLTDDYEHALWESIAIFPTGRRILIGTSETLLMICWMTRSPRPRKKF